jgi:hypothetical protein
MRGYKNFQFVAGMAVVILMVALFNSGKARAADVGNCLLCHKYPGLSRIGENGRFRLFYVNESVFMNSVHAKVKCEGCHTDIKKIPHDPAKKVDCLKECHIIEPSSEQKFSHQEVATFLSKSVHAKVDKYQRPKKYAEDMPYCLDCHDNPLYRPLSLKGFAPVYLRWLWADAGSVIKKTSLFSDSTIMSRHDCIPSETLRILPKCAGDAMMIPR